MKRSIIIVFMALLISAASFAQNDQQQKGQPYRDGSCKPSKYTFCPKHVLYHETHTNFNFLTYNSINYEGTLVCKQKFMLTYRLGGIYYNFVKLRLTGAPIGLNFLFGGNDWLFDAGLGGTYLYIYKNYDATAGGKYKDNSSVVGVNLHVGVRYEIQKAIFFKAVIDPMYVVMGKENVPLMKSAFQPMIGVGIGYTFDD
jgi:hypothetical protein